MSDQNVLRSSGADGEKPTQAATGGASPTAPVSGAPRFHHLDRLRAFLMLWGIPLHAAFLIRGQTVVIDRFLLFGEIWRMATFFLLAAAMSLMVIDRQGLPNWISGRVVRLGVPLLTAILLINPIQSLLIRAQGVNGPTDLLRVRHLSHAWFLAFLIVMCGILFVVLSTAPGRTDRVLRFLGRTTLRNPWTLALTAILLGLLSRVASTTWMNLGLHDILAPLGPKFPIYATFFVFGLVVWRTEDGIRRFGELARGPVLVLAIATLPVTLLRPLSLELPAIPGVPHAETLHVVRYCTSLAWAAILFRVFSRWNKPSTPVVRWLVDASLPVYLIHHVFKFVWQPQLADLTAFPLLNWVIAIVAMTVAAFTAYELLNQFSFTRFAFTGTRRRGQGLTEVLRDTRAARAGQLTPDRP